MKWKTASGEIIDIKEMSDEHLQNSLNMVERQYRSGNWYQAYIGDSDAAEDAVNSENRDNEYNFIEIIKKLKNEQKRRKAGKMNCQVCDQPLMRIKHSEPMDDSYIDVISWECSNDCPYPETPDGLLTPEELKERGKVDTGTEFGTIKIGGEVL
jgi:hypothetical protein